MKTRNHIFSNRRGGSFVAAILAISTSLLLPQVATADTLVGAGGPDIEILNFGPGGGPIPPTEVFDVDTDTGIRTNIQQFTQRGPASITAMDRDSNGTLWGINQPNRLVTIDEVTGIVTDVVALTNPSAYIRGIPAIAFVPGAEETLYAIVKFDGMDPFFAEAPEKSEVVDGFLLVEVDIDTGVVTPVYPVPGGRYGEGLAHGLEYDATYGLVHMWADAYTLELAAKTNGIGIAVELLDPVSETSEQIPYSGPLQPLLPSAKSNSGIIPNGFQATTHSGRPGVIYVYQPGEGGISPLNTKVPSGPFLLGIEIVDDGELSYTTCFEGDIFMDMMTMPMYGSFFESRAMELTGDGEGILLDFGGMLSAFDPQSNEEMLVEEPKGIVASVSWYPSGSVETSIGGYIPEFGSLATDPVSGLIYALSSGGKGRPRSAVAALPKANEKELVGSSGVGLNIIDRNGPPVQELDGVDIPLTDPNIGLMGLTKEVGPMIFSPLTNVEAIAFDDAGVLYGIADGQYLVVIDLPSGEVSAVDGFDEELIYDGFGYQLEFNPADGRLYILFYSHGASGWRLLSCNRDGSDPVSTLVDGPIGEGPTSLVTTGPDSFIFASGLYMDKSTLKGPSGYGFGFFGLGANGATTPPLPGVVPDFYISALTQIPFVPTSAIPDVLVGEKRDRLDGNNIYNPNAGPEQTISIRDTSKKLSGSFFAEVQNDGQTPALFTIAAWGGKKSDDIKYQSNLGNITADLKRGLLTTLGPGARIEIEVKFSRDGDRKFKEKFRIQAIAGGRADAGAVKVKIKPPRSRGPLKPEDLF